MLTKAVIETLESRQMLTVTDITPVDDAYVRGGTYADQHFGNDIELVTKTASADGTRRAFVKYSLDQTGSDITSGKLRLYGYLADTVSSSVTVSVYAVSSLTWDEDTITWNNQPAYDSSTVLAQKVVSNYGPTTAQWYEFDVAGYIQQQKALGKTAVSLMLKAEGTNTARVVFNSKEASANPDVLRVDSTTTPTSPSDPVADAYVRGGTYANDEFGTATSLAVKDDTDTTLSYDRESYLRFNLGTSPITSAKLRVYGNIGGGGTSPMTLGAFAVSDLTWSETAINWSNKPASTGSAVTTATITGTTPQWYELDVTSYVEQQRVAGKSAVSFVLKATSGTNRADLNSREAATNRPQLVIQSAATVAAPTNLSATAASDSEIDLAWTDNATNETGFEVQQSSDGTTGWATIAAPNANTNSHTVSGLADGTTYYFRVRAMNATTQSSWGGPVSATTMQAPPRLDAVGAGAVDEGATYSVDLNLTGNTASITGISIDWGDGTTTTYAKTDTSATHQYEDGDATYSVIARALSGSFVVDSVTHDVNVQNVAPAITLGSVVAVNDGAAFTSTVSIDDASELDGLSAVIDWGDGSSAEEMPNFATGSGTLPLSHAYDHHGIYTAMLTVTDSDGAESVEWFDVTISAVVPSAPTGLAAPSPDDDLRVNLNWNDNPSTPAVDHYVVYRAETAEFGNAAAIATVTQSQYSDTSVLGTTLYYYWVTAVDGSPDESAPSAVASAETMIPAPSSVGSEAANQQEVNLLWGDILSADPDAGEDGYRIEKSTDFGQTFTFAATVAPNATGYTVTGLQPATTYEFRIAATRGGRVGEWVTTTATTKTAPQPMQVGSATISTISQENTVDFGTFTPGTYEVRYVGGAIHYDDSDPNNWWGVVYHEVEIQARAQPGQPQPARQYIAFPRYHPYASESAAEAAILQLPHVIQFHHPGGTIGMHFYDSPYSDNDAGSTRWELYRISEDVATVNVSVDRHASESGLDSERSGRFKVTRSGGDLSQPLEVELYYPPAGTAQRPGDFFQVQDKYTFGPWVTELTSNDILPYQDGKPETTEQIVVYAKGSAKNFVSAPNGAALNITEGGWLDIDVDSSNDGFITDGDDLLEAGLGRPGKIVPLNDGFEEGKMNGDTPVPDNEGTAMIANSDGQLAALDVRLPANAGAGSVTLNWTNADKIKLWRPIAGGGQGADQIGPGGTLSIEAGQTVRLLIEGIGISSGIGDIEITATFQPNGEGTVLQDKVRVTVVDVDVLIGSNDANDESLKDDWVGAADGPRIHTISNHLRMKGPAGLTVPWSLSSGTSGPATPGTVTLQGFNANGTSQAPNAATGTFTLDATGSFHGTFFIKGGAPSSAMDDVTIRAHLNGQLLGSETITVIRFNYEEEVGSQARLLASMTEGNYVINPAVRRNDRQVFAFDIGDATATATDERRHQALLLSGTTPALNRTSNGLPIGKKFGAQDIEVTFGRQIIGATAGSGVEKLTTDGSSTNSQLSVAAAGVNGAPYQSNLRIRDAATTGTGVDGNAYVYYLGHPSESVTQHLAVDQNYARKLVVRTRADLVYTLNINVLEYQPVGGPLQPMPLTVEDAERIASEASSLWEQVGVRFTLAPLASAITTTKATEWNLPSDDVFASVVPITTKRRANGIDVFVVNSIGIGGNNYLAGKTAINLHVGWGRTGIVIARRKTSPTSELENVHELARTMAHEIFHLLNNSAIDDHDNRSWNLVRGGDDPGGSINSDLTTVDARDGLWLFPDKANLDEEQPR